MTSLPNLAFIRLSPEVLAGPRRTIGSYPPKRCRAVLVLGSDIAQAPGQLAFVLTYTES